MLISVATKSEHKKGLLFYLFKNKDYTRRIIFNNNKMRIESLESFVNIIIIYFYYL
jgi:superfamily II DNA/RNA helicase